ncbi:S-layer homology domain-containing protein [Cohnella soli]|uniref:S-layer homology domain-containing protein n=1 Tax=Cohnella soli TaxID=425005 RepID=A0ABW0HU52_9BACL
MRKTLKKSIAIAMASTMVLTYGQAAGAADITKETIPAWASAEMASWKQLGLLKGDANGLIHPNDAVTKAQFLAFVNRVFNYTATSGTSFKDVPATAWYAADIAKASAAGIVLGDAQGNVAPLEILTREKAAIILSRVFEVASSTGSGVKFTDDASISAWATEAVYAMKDAGYVSGTANGAFQPKKALTRAEAVKMINNVMGTLIADSSEHADVKGNNVVVNTAGGSLANATVSGNLYITPGVGEGDFTIENSQIAGTVYVLGGGEHSIIFKNSKAKKVKINKPAGPLRLLLSGNSAADGIEILSSATVVNESPNPIGSLLVSSGSGDTVNVTGNVSDLSMNSGGALNIGESTISRLIFTKQAKESKAKLDKKAKVGSLTVDAPASITGEGTVSDATINSDGVTLDPVPGKLTLNADSATVGGKEVKKGSVGAIGGGGGAPDMSTKLYDYATVLSTFADTGAQGNVKQYIKFMQDPTYKPSIANEMTYVPNLVNAQTFVNQSFTVKPSIFPSMRGINTSVLDSNRNQLWIGTDNGVTKINLTNNEMTAYTKENKQLSDDRVLLLISDGGTGVFAITETGVSYIRQ